MDAQLEDNSNATKKEKLCFKFVSRIRLKRELSRLFIVTMFW